MNDPTYHNACDMCALKGLDKGAKSNLKDLK